MTADPLTAPCSYCGAPAGRWCRNTGGPARKAHARRVRLALALAAHADPALDAHFSNPGPCGICGIPGMPQRHRVVDAIAGMLEAGEDPETTAEEHEVPPEAVETVVLWMVRWPGAWS